jgi:hypothetical protein
MLVELIRLEISHEISSNAAEIIFTLNSGTLTPEYLKRALHASIGFYHVRDATCAAIMVLAFSMATSTRMARPDFVICMCTSVRYELLLVVFL